MATRQPVKSFLWIYAVALAAVAVVFIIGVALLQSSANSSAAVAGAALLCASVLGLIFTLATLPIALSQQAARQAREQYEDDLAKLFSDRLQNISALMTLMSEQQLISERGKTVAFREKDLEAVRRAVQEELGRKNWGAALAL